MILRLMCSQCGFYYEDTSGRKSGDGTPNPHTQAECLTILRPRVAAAERYLEHLRRQLADAEEGGYRYA